MKQAFLRFIAAIGLFMKSLLPYLRYKRILLTAALVIAILLTATWISFAGNSGPDILPYRQNVEILRHGNGLYVAVNDKVLDQQIQAEKCQKISSSVDGTITAFLTDKKELFMVQNQQLLKIADDVLHFEISSSGYGIAFAQKYAAENALTLYDVKAKTRREITTLLSRFDFSLSPNGKSLAYYTRQDKQEVLMCYQNGKTTPITTSDADLVGLADNGKYIYAVCNNTANSSALYSFNLKGSATQLGSVTSISFKFNDDHQQIMFYDNGKTLISTNGQAAVIASSYPLYLVTVPNSQSASDGNAITLPVTSLFNHIYTCSDGESTSAWFIHKNPQKSKKLISRVSSCTLDASAEYLYFIHDQSRLCVMNIVKGDSDFYILAEDADAYAVTANRKRVYYTNDGNLYSTSGRKIAASHLIASNISAINLVMGASDTLYYLNNRNLYICRNSKTPECFAQNINSVYNGANNVVYIIGEDAIYTAYTKKQPIKTLGTD